MYNKLFDKTKQDDMRAYCLNTLAPLGTEKIFTKGSDITMTAASNVAIVTKGKIKVLLYNSKGTEKLLYFLAPGEILGESEFFVGNDFPSIVKAVEDSTLSIIESSALENHILNNPESYNYFIHSVTRKYRIALSQMQDMLFTNSKGKVANTIYRLSIQSSVKLDQGILIDIPLTHQDLANLIGCSRITITRALNDLKSDGIIDIIRKKIVIKNMDALEKLLDD